LVAILIASFYSIFSKAPTYEAWIPELGKKSADTTLLGVMD